MKKHLLALVLVLFACVATWAQRTVTGKVINKQGEVLIGASILAKGTTSGTVADIDGTYSLSAPTNASILVVSYTGVIVVTTNHGTYCDPRQLGNHLSFRSNTSPQDRLLTILLRSSYEIFLPEIFVRHRCSSYCDRTNQAEVILQFA